MLDSVKLQQLRLAVVAEDWVAAANTCCGIKLDRRDALDRYRRDELEKAVRKHNGPLILSIIDGLGSAPAAGSA
jgi:hypothetical protein